MTKQEALQELMDLSIDYGTRTAEEIERLGEAVDMAIAALRADAVDRQTCEDAVSRQQAIDALCNDLCSGHHDCKHYPDCENLKAIQALPAVETEVLKCKDCYWWTKQSDSLQGRCDRYGFYPTGYWYCAAARERRTDDQT